MFISVFHLFQAEIAAAISSFKWQKIFPFMENIDICKIESFDQVGTNQNLYVSVVEITEFKITKFKYTTSLKMFF